MYRTDIDLFENISISCQTICNMQLIYMQYIYVYMYINMQYAIICNILFGYLIIQKTDIFDYI